MTDQTPPWRLEIHDSLPSTSDACIARAEAGEVAGLAVLARRQTKGRGSRGRAWSDAATPAEIAAPSGNLAVSVLLRPEPALDQPGLWPFLAGLAFHDALGGAEGGLMLKWPNDVLLSGRKLAGILVERGVGGGQDWMVIGFGANLATAPALADRKVACLAERGPPPAPEAVAARLLGRLEHWQGVWRLEGFEAIRLAWLARAHPIGTPLAVHLHGAQRTGRFGGLCSDGALLFDHDGRLERVGTGETLLLDGS